jgi:hypothetical protein
LLLLVLGHHFRATNESARIDAQRPADETEYDNRPDPDPRATPGDAATILDAIACR